MVSSLLQGVTSGSGRKVPSWIEGFVDLTSGAPSPELFRRWAGVAVIAGALERKVWLSISGSSILYPNIYALLVGGPGIGKTAALRSVREFWEKLPTLKIAPTSVSRASLTDALNDAVRTVLRPTENLFYKFNSLQVCSEEFGTFLSRYESEFMSTLNHLWDNIVYTEKKRTMKEPIIIPNPQLNLIAATTPAWLSGTLPDTAWAEGFSSRLMLVFSQERIKVDYFKGRATDEKLMESLVHDLRDVHAMYGLFQFQEDFVDLFRAWQDAGFPPEPEHPKLEHYLPRRPIHFLKLCMIMAASRASDFIIRVEDFQEAMNLLVETEAMMPEVFKSMKYNSDSNIIDEVYSFLWQAYSKEGKGISEHRLVRFISERAPSYSVMKILETMISSRVIEIAEIGTGVGGRNTYKPAPKKSF